VVDDEATQGYVYTRFMLGVSYKCSFVIGICTLFGIGAAKVLCSLTSFLFGILLRHWPSGRSFVGVRGVKGQLNCSGTRACVCVFACVHW
jgi:hypothetical protein